MVFSTRNIIATTEFVMDANGHIWIETNFLDDEENSLLKFNSWG